MEIKKGIGVSPGVVISTAIVLPAGSNSRKSSSRFAVTTGEKLIAPVAFPPGRARLATRPYFTGSPPPVNMIGMVEVAAFATTAGCKPPVATMTVT